MSQGTAVPVSVERSPRRFFLLVLLTAAMFFCYAHRVAFSAATPFLMKELGLNTAVAGVLLSAFFWSYSLAQVPAGWLIDRYGMGPIYAAGFALWAGALALLGACSSVGALIVVRMLMGLGQGAAFPASARAVANWFSPKERGGVTGVYLSGNRIGQAAILAVAPPAIAAFGWRTFFVIAAAAGILWLLPWLLSLRWFEAVPADRPSNRRASAGSRLIWRERKIAGIFLGFFAFDYVWFVLQTWMPGYLMLERKFTPGEMAIASSTPFLAASLFTVLAGVLGDYLVRRGWHEVTARKTMITTGLAAGALIVPAGLVADKMLCAWLLAGSICGLGFAAPNAWALTQAVCEKEVVATASGIQNFGGNLGGVLAPALTGYIAHTTGSFGLAFMISGAVLAGGIACYWALIPKREAVTR